jgi:Peptidase family S41/Bacterial Ig-like domain
MEPEHDRYRLGWRSGRATLFRTVPLCPKTWVAGFAAVVLWCPLPMQVSADGSQPSEGWQAGGPPPLDTAQAAKAFDRLWEAFDEDYAMFILRPEVDWGQLRAEFRPKALASRSVQEFAEVCAQMLRPLRDLHVWLTVAGQPVPVYNRPRTANSNPSAHQALLGNLHQEGRVQWTVTADKIGFLAIYGWNNDRIPAFCDQALAQMRDTRGLILDVRLNGGGSEDLARDVAGRFVPRSFVYAYSRFRNGPAHTNLTAKIERRVAPRGPWRYDRPVVVLIGQKCMSSNESFVAMMSGDPDALLMGDHTCGSSGNPELINLALNMTVSVPRWIDYLPNGTPLDERGFQPQVQFHPGSGAFQASRDDLLSAALARLRQAPLPQSPIRATEVVPNSIPPVVISTVPQAGASDVDPGLAEIRVAFSKSMVNGSWSWSTWGEETFPQTTGRPHYLSDARTCVLPVKLESGKFYAIWLNSERFKNFKDASGQPAVPYLLTFRTRVPQGGASGTH